ncbi:MAG: serine/threonine protein kinase [Sandaracinus sp.]|nr:serine/threonine protein kinase [Sandaracinus sp.]MCB9622387.1 serine/threonine protein kinase [Sandaracinus sp.]
MSVDDHLDDDDRNTVPDGPARLAGKYELVSVLGRGGMATVWRGFLHGEQGFRRSVAIKQLLPGVAASQELSSMFVEEARVVSVLEHPNVVQVFDFGRDDEGQHFIVMELVEGLDLGTWIVRHVRRGKKTAWPIVAAIGVDILRGLGAAHERRNDAGASSPIFHRDLTPSNVLLSRYGIAKLGDFGLARAADRITVTGPGVVKGKLAYVAPEMVSGARASAASDLYSLGIVLWEALASRRVHDDVSEVELFVRVGRGDVPPLAKERDDLPRGLVAVVERLLALRPDDRYVSASEARTALANVLRLEREHVTQDDIAAYLAELR